MELEILEKNSNPLLSRQEIHVVIKHEGDSTPKRNQVINSLSKELKAKKDLIIIDYLKNQYGKSETKGYAKIYDTKDSMKLIETKPSLARHKNINEEPKQEKNAESVEEKTDEAEENSEEGDDNEKD
tara:strand:- start:345 stop:725 length:381 start_codon:yes stop_codon:yes gene_type:complete